MVVLPCGEEICVDRGAEQGDPLGPAYCGFVLADVVEAAVASMGGHAKSLLDVWYMDDGQVFLPPCLVDPFLRALDVELERIGATRGSGPDVKSTARLLSSGTAVTSTLEWATAYVRDTCKVRGAAEPLEVLGIRFGEPATEQLHEAMAKMEAVHGALGLLEDAGVELTLARNCADVCRLVHQLRARGPDVPVAALQAADATLNTMLGDIVGSPVPAHCMQQASLGVKAGGLGLRRATSPAIPAYVAARTDARPIVETLMETMPAEWDASASILDEYDARTASAVGRLRLELAPAAADCLDQVLAEGTQLATERYSSLTRMRGDAAGSPAAVVGHPLVDLAPTEAVLGLGSDAGLQAKLCGLMDMRPTAELLQHFRDTHDWEGLRRFEELRHTDCDHGWLMAIHPAHGAFVPADEYADGIRIRLGLAFADGPVPCAACEDGLLDASCSHALRCAPSACTRGHNAVRTALMSLASLADPAACVEPLGVIPSVPNARPADVLSTAALPGCTAALDVGVISPDSAGAGPDCCEAMVRKKLRTYAAHLPELAGKGIRYVPMAISCYGRLHPEAALVVRRLSVAAARRQGAADALLVERRARCWISVAVLRRAVAMVRACLPALSREQVEVLVGADPAVADACPPPQVVSRGAAAALLQA